MLLQVARSQLEGGRPNIWNTDSGSPPSSECPVGVPEALKVVSPIAWYGAAYYGQPYAGAMILSYALSHTPIGWTLYGHP